MTVEIGHFALVLALCAALTQTIIPAWGARTSNPDLMAVGRSAGLTRFALAAAAFAALVNAHLTSDFSVLNVAENSHSAAPTIYKISGVWGNHEGSMLLWVLILATFGADSVAERIGLNYKETVTAMTVRSGGALVATIAPARRQFAAREMTTTEAGMATLNFGQVYVSNSDPTLDGAVPARLYWKRLVTLIRLGGAAMALGSVLSRADRRLRFGVAVRARSSAVAAQAAE